MEHSTESTPPWEQGRREFTGAHADLARSRRSWKYISFGLLALLALVTVSLIGFATSSRVEPYIIEKDQLGRVRYSGPIPAAPDTPEDQLVRAELRLLINDLRTVSSDQQIQEPLIDRAFVHLRSDAREYLNNYFSEPGNNPNELNANIRRTVNVGSVLPVPDSDTWKVEWTESTTPIGSGGEPSTSSWEAYVSLTQQDPQNQQEAAENPLGLYVTSIEWTQVGSGGSGEQQGGNNPQDGSQQGSSQRGTTSQQSAEQPSSLQGSHRLQSGQPPPSSQ